MALITEDTLAPRLAQLPKEIQDHIFRYLVVRAEPIKIEMRRVLPSKWGRGHRVREMYAEDALEYNTIVPQQPAIAQVNQNLRHTILPIYFGENTFVFEYVSFREDNLVDAILPWLELYGRYATTSARVGVYLDTGYRSTVRLTLFVSCSRGGITYEWDTPLDSQDWRVPNVEWLYIYHESTILGQAGVTPETMFRACQEDMKRAWGLGRGSRLGQV